MNFKFSVTKNQPHPKSIYIFNIIQTEMPENISEKITRKH